MKRILTVSLGLLFLLTLCACSAAPAASTQPSESASASAAPSESPSEAPSESPSESASAAGGGEIIVFAAASMQETMDEIGANYEAENGVKVTYNFDSSGTLKTQIEEGAPCDLFISAAQKQMNGLEEASLIDSASRINLLENKVVLAVQEGNPAGLTSFEDMAEKLKAGEILLAIGNSDVPVGQYTQEIFAYLGLNEEELAAAGSITYGTNVKEVTTQVTEGSVAAGLIYATDAYSAGLEAVAEATKDMCKQVIYPAAILANAPDAEAAAAFLKYIQTPECMKIFEGVGFSPAPAK